MLTFSAWQIDCNDFDMNPVSASAFSFTVASHCHGKWSRRASTLISNLNDYIAEKQERKNNAQPHFRKPNISLSPNVSFCYLELSRLG
jgi:hypothetical protein